MPRNKEFKSRPPPLSHVEGADLQPESVSGPLPFFNPTRARYDVKPLAEAEPGAEGPGPRAQLEWRARDNRKGRHALVVEKDRRAPTPTSSARAILHGLKRMATECPYWDVSYLVAVFFTVGCGIFIACGFFDWLPLAAPSSEFPGETEIVGGVTAFVGATLFQVGAVLLVFEACNENQTGCFGWALERVLHVDSDDAETAAGGVVHPSDEGAGADAALLVKPRPDACSHRHQRGSGERKQDRLSAARRRWEWWPSWDEFTTHYIHEMGWVASISMAVGATIFYVSGICALPGIYSNMSQGLAYGLYWLTYLVGGILFIFSSVLYVLETQPNWYTPAPHLLGWHIGVWNLVGSVGWTLAASFGYCEASWCEYQGELALTWASVAFFVGSALLWYEALQKHPIETERKRS